MSQLLAPTETSGDVCFRAAVDCVADIKRALICGVLIGGPPKLKEQRRNRERGCCPSGKSLRVDDPDWFGLSSLHAKNIFVSLFRKA
jgi:hypothetical protein